ncbi:MAG TPA: SRPBCC family protein [Polyangiaceae bacterium]|jgi:hypothetical protein
MATISTTEFFPAAPQRVWEFMTDAVLLQRLGACDSLRGLNAAPGELFGEGAVREVRLGALRFVERIKKAEVGRCLEVEVLEAAGPINQEYERVDLRPRDHGSEVTWTIRFTLKIPIFREYLSRLVAVFAKFHFRRFVRKFKAHIEAHADAHADLATASR